ncbi:MAG: hypothetical protein ACM4D3_09100 [Candidatus Sericytochromatia bacterium]
MHQGDDLAAPGLTIAQKSVSQLSRRIPPIGGVTSDTGPAVVAELLHRQKVERHYQQIGPFVPALLVAAVTY